MKSRVGSTKDLRSTWCSLKIFCIYIFAILIGNEVIEMKWFNVGEVEWLVLRKRWMKYAGNRPTHSNQVPNTKHIPMLLLCLPGNLYRYHDIKIAKSLEGRLSNSFLAMLNYRHWNCCHYIKCSGNYLTLHGLRLVPGTALGKGKKRLKSVRKTAASLLSCWSNSTFFLIIWILHAAFFFTH